MYTVVPGRRCAVGDARARAAAEASPRRSRNVHVSSLPSARDTMSQRPPSCWNASRPIAFSPSVRSSPALADSNRLRATWRRRSGDMPRPTSSTAITAMTPSTPQEDADPLAGDPALGVLVGRVGDELVERVLRILVRLARHQHGLGEVADAQPHHLAAGARRRSAAPLRWCTLGAADDLAHPLRAQPVPLGDRRHRLAGAIGGDDRPVALGQVEWCGVVVGVRHRGATVPGDNDLFGPRTALPPSVPRTKPPVTQRQGSDA